jgi:hypothetical protein
MILHAAHRPYISEKMCNDTCIHLEPKFEDKNNSLFESSFFDILYMVFLTS